MLSLTSSSPTYTVRVLFFKKTKTFEVVLCHVQNVFLDMLHSTHTELDTRLYIYIIFQFNCGKQTL